MPTLTTVAGLIPSLKTAGGIVVKRRGLPTKNQFGEYTRAAPALIPVQPAVIHNLSGRELDQVPEANRNLETIQVYTRVRLFVSDGGHDADIVRYRGRRFKIIQVMDYELQGGVYISVAQLEDIQTQ